MGEIINKKDSKILFIHNTLVWFRVPLFKLLSKYYDVEYIFTKLYIIEKTRNVHPDIKNMSGTKFRILKNYFGIAFGLIPLLAKEQYAMVVLPPLDTTTQILDAFIILVIAKLIRGKPIIIWSEAWEYKTHQSFKQKLLKITRSLFVKLTDAYVVPGIRAKEYLIKLGANRDKIFIAPNASYVEPADEDIEVREKYNIPTNKKIILYLSRIIPRKGLDILIYAFKKVENERDDVFLLVVGDGEFRDYCENLAKKLKIQNIKFVGYVPHKEKVVFYSQCNIFVLPSVYYGFEEAWGLVLNEVMQVGKPCIATDVVGAAYDIIQNGINGFIVPEKNVNELYKVIKRIVENPKLERKMAMASKKILKTRFTYQHMSEGFKKAFQMVVR